MFEGSRARATGNVSEVERAALLATLRDGAAVPVVAIHAGAGYGKTTVARQWAAHDSRPHLVVRVAPFLDAPAALALALVDALETLGTGAGQARSVATGAEPAFSSLLLPTLTRLAASRGRPYVLVVDDVQLLADPACHLLLRAMADGVPEGSQLALLSRTDPPPWLARTRAEGRLLELGPSDLALDDDEARLLLAGLGSTLSPDQVRALVDLAEGWAVGLYLMGLALTARGSPGRPDAGVTAAGSDRFVVDYLRAEVLAGLSRSTYEFLRRTSILHELEGSLCDAVLERRDSAAVLSGLSRQLQLVVALDAQGSRYRYHHLLADALSADLAGQEPWLVPELHHRASVWFESHADLGAAIRHATAAGDLGRVGTLVWAGIPRCIASGRPDLLRSWLSELDDAQIRSDRWLALAAAWLGLQTGDPDRMTRWILAAEEHAGPGWQTRVATDEFTACVAAIHVTIGDCGLEGSIELCRGVQRALPRDSPFRAAAFQNEGVALTLTRQFPLGQASLQQAEHLGRALGVPVVEANALAWQGLLALLADDWAHGAPLIARAGELIELHSLDRLATSATSVTALALLQAARGNREQARVTLGTARRLTGQVSRIAPWFAVVGPLVQARAAILLGDGALARSLQSQAKAHMSQELAGTLLHDVLVDTESMLRTLQADGVSAGALTAAELRVLQFLPSRLTFPQIGEHLFLSQTTIKTHAQAIYRKLGASSRDDAVARAQSLGLVESPIVE